MDSISKSGITVLHVVTRMDQGGSAGVVLELTRGLSQDGMKVALVVGRTDDPLTDLDAFAAQAGIKLYKVPELIRAVSPFNDK